VVFWLFFCGFFLGVLCFFFFCLAFLSARTIFSQERLDAPFSLSKLDFFFLTR